MRSRTTSDHLQPTISSTIRATRGGSGAAFFFFAIKSMVIEPGHPLHASFGGIHHLYANEKAIEGYRAGKFPEGSIIIFDLLEAVSAENAVTEGERKVVGVMHEDSGKFAATGGWGFEGFAGNSKTERAVGAKAAEACFGCHTSQKASDYVFSRYRS